MIERYDLDAKGQADPNGAWFWVDDVEHLLRPPTWIVDPIKGDIPVHYTPDQWRQWFVDNRVPVQEWTGPVWAVWTRGKGVHSYLFPSMTGVKGTMCDVILIANEAGKPPDDYACER